MDRDLNKNQILASEMKFGSTSSANETGIYFSFIFFKEII